MKETKKPNKKAVSRTVHFEKYFGSGNHLLRVYDKSGRKYRFEARDPSEFKIWKSRVRSKLRNLIGLSRMESCPMEPVETEDVLLDEGIHRRRILIQTEPDVWMPLYLLIPPNAEKRGPLPCVIACHGHNSAGKLSTAGRTDIPAVRDQIRKLQYDYGLRFCRLGYLVFCPDARGFGERREIHRQGGKVWNSGDDEATFLGDSCSVLSRLAGGLGQTVAGMMTWDLMRLIDYILTVDEGDPKRIGCVGLSGGGLQTLWISALEDRIKCTVVSGNFFGFRDSLLQQIRCECSYVPRLLEYVDVGDIGAVIAPKPLLIETGTEDYLAGPRGRENCDEQVAVTRGAYGLLDMEDRFYYHKFDGPHEWNGGKTYNFVSKWL